MKQKTKIKGLVPATYALLGWYVVVVGGLIGVVLLAHLVAGWGLMFPAPAVASASDRGVIDGAQSLALTARLIGGELVTADRATESPVGVMVENLPTTRPQSGLGAARLVYETLAEGGVTRFLVVVYPSDLTGKVGPVRSARHYYVDWAEELGVPYAHAGGSPQALQQIARNQVPDLNGIGNAWRYFWRDRQRAAPHNLFTDGEHVTQAIRELSLHGRADVTPWSYADPPSPRPTLTARAIEVDFSGQAYAVRYEYDQSANSYRRFNGGQPHVDKSTDQQLSAANVVVQFVPRPTSLGEKGRIDIETVGQGRALVFNNGTVVKGAWKKSSVRERTEFVAADGLPVTFNRGTTWVAVVPEDRPVTYR